MAGEQRPFDVAVEMMRLTLRIVGPHCSAWRSAQTDTVAVSVTTLNEAFGEFNLIDVFAPFIPTARRRNLRTAVGALDAIVYGIIA